MGNLCIIPARGGSKRIPRKNIRPFLGKPIISYPIQTALKSNLFDTVMVSTEDLEIKKIAELYGADVPFIRNQKNANDFATLTDVIEEVLGKFEEIGKKYENVCCILPTSALVTKELITQAYHKLNENVTTVLPVLKYPYPIQRALKNKDEFLFLNAPKHINSRTQDLEDFFYDSGQFYWIKSKNFLKEKKIYSSKMKCIELKEYQAQDIDNLDDLVMLELKYNYKIKI